MTSHLKKVSDGLLSFLKRRTSFCDDALNGYGMAREKKTDETAMHVTSNWYFEEYTICREDTGQHPPPGVAYQDHKAIDRKPLHNCHSRPWIKSKAYYARLLHEDKERLVAGCCPVPTSSRPSGEWTSAPLDPLWSLAFFGSDSASKVEARRASRGRVTFEKETRRKRLAGRDEYGGSSVFWYCSAI
jgi:hypothetical protein